MTGQKWGEGLSTLFTLFISWMNSECLCVCFAVFHFSFPFHPAVIICETSEAGDWSCHLNQFTASTVSAFEYVIRWNLALSEKHILASYCLPVRWKHTDNMLNQWYQWIKSLLLTRMGPTIWAGFSMTKKKRCVVWNKHIIPWNIHLWHLYS